MAESKQKLTVMELLSIYNADSASDGVLADIYLAPLPMGGEPYSVTNASREREINEAKYDRVKREKYFVWRLLELAVENSLGKHIDKLALERNEFGRWISPICDISLSHSGSALAVAISASHIGIDIQEVAQPHSLRFAERVLTAAEFNEYSALADTAKPEYLIKKWTAKEALFKSLNLKTFIPNKTEPTAAVKTFDVEILGEKYYCSVAATDNARIRVFKCMV